MKKTLFRILSLIVAGVLFSCANPVGSSGQTASRSLSVGSVSLSLSDIGGIGDPDGLGVYYTSSSSRFSIWSPDTSDVKLVLDGTEYSMSLDSSSPFSDVYSVTVQGDFNLKEYYYLINGTAVRDPYGVMVKPGTDVNIVVDLSQTDPVGGWAARPTLSEREDAVIYEAHIRDFTIDPNSGVSTDKRGKFLGMVETGTTCNGYSTGIDHLKELGINTLQILPFYDFGTEQYNWGYDPVNFNVPEEQYSSDPTDYIGRIRELKTMINEFHKNGIRVVMDVVYNHTFDKSVLGNITSRYYTSTDLSGCGNSLNSDEGMVDRMILDSLKYWAGEYNIDGFRFDLMGVFHYDVVNEWGVELNKVFPDRNLLLYGEPWNGGTSDPEESVKVRLGKVPAMSVGHIGVFNPKYRDAVKGSTSGTDGGYIFNNGVGNEISMGSRGGILYSKSTSPLSNLWDPMYAYDPEQSIDYISAHDNLNLWDKIKHVGITGDYAKRIDMFGMGMIMTSQGIPFMHEGDEFLRTKVYNGDWTYADNSYNAPDEYNEINWDLKSTNHDIFNYYKDLIALRENHPGFRMNTWDEINSNVSTNVINDQVIATTIDAGKNGDSWNDIIVIYNSGNAYTYSLPSGEWEVVAEDIDGSTSRIVTGSVLAAGTAVTVLRRVITNDLVIHYSEFEYADSYTLHPWDGLDGDTQMTYEGYFNNRYWWEVDIPNRPDYFKFCFTDSNGNWDGDNRIFNNQADEVYVLPYDTTVYTARP